MTAFIKSVTFDCHDPLTVAAFWAAALGSDVDEDSTPDRAWVEPAGWGGPNLWFQKVPEGKSAKNRQHFDLGSWDGWRASATGSSRSAHPCSRSTGTCS